MGEQAETIADLAVEAETRRQSSTNTTALTAGDLRFELLRNAAYHSDALWFFSLAHRAIMFFSVLMGSAAVTTILAGYQNATISVSLVVTALATIDLVCDLTGKARKHDMFRFKYFSLLGELGNGEKAALRRVNDKIYELWADEPPIMYAVEAMAWNSAKSSTTSELKLGDLIPIKRRHRMLRHIWPFSAEDFRRPEIETSQQRA